MSKPRKTICQMPYDIQEHNHRFAAWAAGRAASVKRNRFTVANGRIILERAGFTRDLCEPSLLPTPRDVDEWHRKRRSAVIDAAKDNTFTHGVAAKLINVYLKARFVCPGNANHANVAALHPPVDEILIRALYANDYGGLRTTTWRIARKVRWSNFGSDLYEKVVQGIRTGLEGQPMWMIEEYWAGHQ